ncbi:MAG TPA: ABC transporter substrate-binding protein [Gaiellaceae bacterium]|nr:ABC transporter substrate-binding protein [Gaiellaceae bacterium]
MDDAQRRVNEIRAGRNEIENHVIDEFVAGRLSRREFIRRGSVVGMSIPLLSFLAAACGGGGGGTSAPTGGGQTLGNAQAGGTIRAGTTPPATKLNPLLVQDQGGLSVLSQSGEFLNFSDSELNLRPVLAESWTPNDDASVWTFKIRQGVTFQDGTPMGAKDVVGTFDRLSNPDTGGNALSAIGGIIEPGSTKAIDDATVEFTLSAPNGNFPYLVSSDNYNAIILPADFDPDTWEQSFMGTGPWKLQKYTPKVGVTYTKNPNYWSPNQPLADALEMKFYADEQAAVLAIQSGQTDVQLQFSVAGGQALLNNPDITVIKTRSAAHRQVHMRTDMDPFKDKRVRQAMGLLLDRQAIVDGLFDGLSDIGDDHPFAPVFPSADTSIEQREKNVEQAKQLMADAGMSNGFSVKLETWRGFEIPDYAVLIQNAAKEVGGNIQLSITDSASYYGDGTYGNSRWLDSTMGITEYGHRGVPNVFLDAPLRSDGTWNSAHFKNDTYDGLVDDYVAAVDVQSQKGVARKIEELLLDETPIIFSYFYNFLTATRKNVTGVEPSAMGHLDMREAGFVS